MKHTVRHTVTQLSKIIIFIIQRHLYTKKSGGQYEGVIFFQTTALVVKEMHTRALKESLG